MAPETDRPSASARFSNAFWYRLCSLWSPPSRFLCLLLSAGSRMAANGLARLPGGRESQVPQGSTLVPVQLATRARRDVSRKPLRGALHMDGRMDGVERFRGGLLKRTRGGVMILKKWHASNKVPHSEYSDNDE